MQKEETIKFIKEKNKRYTLIWLFLVVELAVFFSFFYFYLNHDVSEIKQTTDGDFNTIFLYLSYLTVIIAVPLVYKFYDVKKKQAEKLTDVKQTADKYFMTILIIYSIFEFAAVFTLIAFYINKMVEPLYMFGIIYVAVLLNKPSLKRFMQQILKEEESHVVLTEEEKTELKNSENPINKK